MDTMSDSDNKEKSINTSDFMVNAAVSDTTTPAVPTFGIFDNLSLNGERGHYLNPGDATDDSTPMLLGSNAEAGSIVKIFDNHVLIGSVTASSAGGWVFEMPDSSDGLHSISVTATNAAGNTSDESNGFVLNIEATPAAPVIENVYDNVGEDQGYGMSGVSTEDTMPKLSGSADAGSIVKILDNGVLIGSATANSDGNWSFIPPVQDEGEHIFTATATNVIGKTSGESVDFVVNIDFSNDSTPPTEPTFSIFDNLGLNGEHGHYLNSGDVTDDSTPFLLGSDAEAGSIVMIYDNDVLIGSTLASDGGFWAFETSERSDGLHNFSVAATDAAGNMSTEAGDFVVNIAGPATLAQVNDTNNLLATDISDHSQNTLQLTLNDIINDAHDNLFMQDGHKQLAVTGDAGDVVELKVEDLAHNTWQDAGQVTAGGVHYEVYQHADSNVELLVQQGLELHQVS